MITAAFKGGIRALHLRNFQVKLIQFFQFKQKSKTLFYSQEFVVIETTNLFFSDLEKTL